MKKKKVSIVFHSVTGNNFIIAREFLKEFTNLNADVSMLRVKDDNFEEIARQFSIAGQFKNEILNCEIASPDKLLKSDIIIIGSPTYFGNVSGAMKHFMDSFSPYWQNAEFYGKKLFAFSTCGNSEGGGDLCLNAINIFGQHMGMTPIAVPSNLLTIQSFSAYGLKHYSGDFSNIRPSANIINAIKSMAKILVNI